ncbi:MAG: GTP-binding protein [Silicimonas sp.]|nr:GTP-binding protein [Silicimonas sp.]
MSALPLSVIGGYLGAGKTTLINTLLAGDHGLRLAVLVNDFGAINLDAALLHSAREDTIELTNGCICCTMSGDLFYAIGDMLDRHPRPDHLIVEASGIADPARIAGLALAEPDLRYGGIISLADSENLAAQLSDGRITDQVAAQLTCADLVAVSKGGDVGAELAQIGLAAWCRADNLAAIAALLFDATPECAPEVQTAPHPDYVHYSDPDPAPRSQAEIEARLADLPPGLLRLKALLPDGNGAYWEVHAVGRQKHFARRAEAATTALVAIGLAPGTSAERLAAWWDDPSCVTMQNP